MELYMQNREHGRMILESVENGPLIWPTIEEKGVTRTKKYAKLSAAKKIQADYDMKATNIILQGLPASIYSLVNHHRFVKDLWERVQLLMQGTSLTKQERECKLYDAFDKFTHIKEESLHKYYLRFTHLINDMNIYNMKIEQFQVNTKFLNSLLPEWSKFVTDVKIVKGLHTTNFDQLHAYLEQHEPHANEVRFVVPVFSIGDDPIACLNKAMAFLTAVASLRGDKDKVILVLAIRVMLLVLGETMQVDKQRLLNATTVKTEDLDTYDSDCDDISNAKAILMANISNYGSDVISEVPHSETYLNDMDNQGVHAMQDFEQTPAVDVTDNEITTPKELPKVILVNESLKKLKFHLAKFDNVVKIRTTPDARTEIFDQMDAAVQQSSVDKQCLEIAKKELHLENDRLLQQIMSQDVLLTVMNSMSLNGESVNIERKRNESCDKSFNLDAELLKSQNAHNDLLKKLENSVAKLLLENERLCNEINHVKQVSKEQFDLIKKTCVRTKEHNDSLIDKLNLKSTENEDLKAQIQDKVFVITSLKNDLRKVKSKEIVDITTQIPSANTIVPRMFKLDLEPLAPMLLQNREAHIDYLKYTHEQADIIREIVNKAKAKQPLRLK
ncbi:hypothetical protein Tco_0303618 [Tanacetum coccineum]